MGEPFLWMGRGRWGYVEVDFGWLEMGGGEWGLVGVVTRFSITHNYALVKYLKFLRLNKRNINIWLCLFVL